MLVHPQAHSAPISNQRHGQRKDRCSIQIGTTSWNRTRSPTAGPPSTPNNRSPGLLKRSTGSPLDLLELLSCHPGFDEIKTSTACPGCHGHGTENGFSEPPRARIRPWIDTLTLETLAQPWVSFPRAICAFCELEPKIRTIVQKNPGMMPPVLAASMVLLS